MIRLTLEMTKERYRQLEEGIDIGLFEFSLKMLDNYEIRIIRMQEVEE